MKRWTVRDGEGTTIGAIVRLAGADAEAVADGRVFVGRRRASSDDDAVAAGDQVSIAPARIALATEVRILARRVDIIAVEKPAGLATIADHGGSAGTLVAEVARLLAAGEAGPRPGTVGKTEEAPHPTSRLDREVSGVVVFALTRRARLSLDRARNEGRYQRRYVAIATDLPALDTGTWDAPIGRASDPRHRAAFGREAVDARTHYRVIARARGAMLLALAPETGRTHQLRVHASHAGAPMLGDVTYGGAPRVTLPDGRVLALPRVALHAARVTVPSLRADAPIPAALRDLWAALGGAADAWDTAVACDLPPPPPSL